MNQLMNLFYHVITEDLNTYDVLYIQDSLGNLVPSRYSERGIPVVVRDRIQEVSAVATDSLSRQLESLKRMASLSLDNISSVL